MHVLGVMGLLHFWRGLFIAIFARFGMAYCIDGMGVNKLLIGNEGIGMKCKGERH